jgi:hypothetical protein
MIDSRPPRTIQGKLEAVLGKLSGCCCGVGLIRCASLEVSADVPADVPEDVPEGVAADAEFADAAASDED